MPEPAAWYPLAAEATAGAQCGHIVNHPSRWRPQRSTLPWWLQYFWQDVTRMAQFGVDNDGLLVLRSAGYIGAGATSVPPQTL